MPARILWFLVFSFLTSGFLVFVRFTMAQAGILNDPFTAITFWAAWSLVVLFMMFVMLRRHLSPIPDSVGRPDFGKLLSAFLIAAFAYMLAFWGATRVVPMQQDQDMVLICPAYGFFTHLRPFGLETRFPYQFNKPPALYFLTTPSVVLRGEFELARPFCESGMEALPVFNSLGRRSKETISALRDGDIERFFGLPRLAASVRIPATGIATVLAVTLFLFSTSMGLPNLPALLSTVAVITLPEVFIRSSFAGWTTISLLQTLLIMWLYAVHRDKRERVSSDLLVASAFLALTNHKALFLIPALILSDFYLTARSGLRRNLMSDWLKHSWRGGVFLGAVLGTVVYWLYGAAIDFEIFLHDHVFYDFLDRFARGHDMTYPTMGELWSQWVRNLSYITIPWGLLCLVWLLVKDRRNGIPLAVWSILGAVLVSMADWKQTKHLMLILMPFVTAPILCWSFSSRVARVIWTACWLITILVSCHILIQLFRDFSYLTPSKVW